jgi:ABC-type transport system involved in multi-copper enzyme maturation permease subunit
VSALLIARNTFREAMRDRLVAGVVGGGLVLLAATQVLAPLAMGEGLRLTVDLGLTGITLLGLLVILMAGTSLVAKEIERRTIYNLLSRPIARHSYLVGKWAGLTGTLWATVAILGAGLGLLLVVRGESGHFPSLAQALLLAGLELSLITALAVLFSALSTPALSALYTLGAFLAGQWSDDLRGFASRLDPVSGTALETVSHLVPHLSLFNMRTLAASGDVTSGLHLGLAAGYALLYITCVLALASAAFESRDFK